MLDEVRIADFFYDFEAHARKIPIKECQNLNVQFFDIEIFTIYKNMFFFSP